ncbi:PAS domain S-box protein [Devosia sp. YIM 151766]|uniref:PAS domain S-box protein n=1 Tax=Devosia sp. YIM 151766 TaxID=3017325 RepID=UPI00255CA43D|nr:PAS domain S-box protein [Devosia sp. YIM 151766]WIY54023.1 PAS domain S-box protein [Devosia sp. YIM 151766]
MIDNQALDQISWAMDQISNDIDAIANARLAAIVDSSFDAIISKDLNSQITSWNIAAERMFGYSAEEAIGRSILMLIPERLQSEETDIIERVRRGERVESFDTTRVRKDGTLISVSITVSPIKDANGGIVGASKIARDVSEAKEAERRISLLLREVNHRVKNQFAVILSIIRESSNRAVAPSEFEGQVRARIMALSRSHDLLVNSDWSGASLFELVQEHLTIFGHDEKVTLSGPLITLAPNAVQHLGMAMHELGTNAAKYGALASARGQVRIAWQIIDDRPDASQFELVWEETFPAESGEPAEPIVRRGFGTVVLERVVPLALNGRSTLEREPGRVRWTLTTPLDSLVGQAKEQGDEPDELYFNPI